MKKSILFTLPLVATMLASCGSKGDSASNPVIDPDKGTKIEATVAAQNLVDAAKVSTASGTLGLALVESAVADVTVNMPQSDETGAFSFKNVHVTGSEDASLEVGLKGLDQKGVTGIRGSAALEANLAYEVTGDEELLASLGDKAKLDVTANANAYFDGSKVYFDLNQGLVDLANLFGTQIMAAGKYASTPMPEEMVAQYADVKFSDMFTGYVTQYADTIKQYAAMIPAMIGEMGEFLALKLSDTEFAFYVDLDGKAILPLILSAAAKVDPAMIQPYLALLTDEDVIDIEASVTFDTAKGLEAIALYADVDVDLTFGEMMGPNAEALSDEVKNTKLIDAAASLGLELDFLTGSKVKVSELSDAQKAEYKEMNSGSQLPR